MDCIECRKVGIEDYDSVMAIRTDVYDGLDYLPALYRTIMTNHTGYAVFVNEIMVGFECVSLIDDGETLIARAARIRKEYVGRGLAYHLRNAITRDNANKPKLIRSVYTSGNKTLLQRVEEGRAELVLQKAILFYKGLMSNILPSLPTVDNTIVRILTKEDLKKLLSSKTDTDKLFPQRRIIVDWVPYRLLATNVDHFFNEFCHILGSDLKDGKSEGLECISLAVGYSVPNGIRYNVELYGNFTEEILSIHMAEHLGKCSTFGKENINLLLHYEHGTHDADVLTQTMHQFGMNVSNNFHSKVMYGMEEPMVPLSKY
ncbi:histidine N-acetyltransferase-like [Ylistrum balloti]|uniref:histidine N-acetyltransferase-like n=1 Tax=Ylistrum balloti TaxID=509963 RepID=UPI002905925A|nr:histidine N-acetyltransferase-like [Ylistrum balloti]XP_060075968.1 histidine N-acetyltransferase-like [Ylistrum balloti]XP_060075970.1 histidine N-acetyltransferase-like [Ylistrum balloti]